MERFRHKCYRCQKYIHVLDPCGWEMDVTLYGEDAEGLVLCGNCKKDLEDGNKSESMENSTKNV